MNLMKEGGVQINKLRQHLGKVQPGIPNTGTIQRVKLAIAPSDNNYIYAATVDTQSGLQVYKSTNAGRHGPTLHPR